MGISGRCLCVRERSAINRSRPSLTHILIPRQQASHRVVMLDYGGTLVAGSEKTENVQYYAVSNKLTTRYAFVLWAVVFVCVSVMRMCGVSVYVCTRVLGVHDCACHGT